MPKRREEPRDIPISISLPEALYGWVEFAAHQKGITVSDHIRQWIISSLEPWEGDTPLPLDAHSVQEWVDSSEEADEITAPSSTGSPDPTEHPGLRLEDFPNLEAYQEAEKADRQARAQATRKRNREAQAKVIPDHIRAIAEARKDHPDLSLRDFSQLLFEQAIYTSRNTKTGEATLVSSGTLSVWLSEARAAGLLPSKPSPKRTPASPTFKYPQTPKP